MNNQFNERMLQVLIVPCGIEITCKTYQAMKKAYVLIVPCGIEMGE